MARKKLDGLVEAVRLGKDGNIAAVRIYERRGATYGDWKVIGRDELVQRLKKGQHIAVGERIPYLASTFQVLHPLRLVGDRGDEKWVATATSAPSHDQVDGAPFF